VLYAVGEAVAGRKAFDREAVAWLHGYYRAKFVRAIDERRNSWTDDRDRVTAVARWFAERALDYAGASPLIERHAAEQAAAEIEAGCRMNARRDTAADGGVS
jgi:hypothetical protein